VTSTQAFRDAAHPEEGGDPFIVLLVITADELDTPLRVTDAAGSWDDDLECDTLVVAGATYLCCPFELEPPGQSDQEPRGRLRVQNVDARIGEALEALRDPATVSVTIALESDPATAIDGPYEALRLRNVRVDAIAAEGDLVFDDFGTEPFPQEVLDERLVPGAYR